MARRGFRGALFLTILIYSYSTLPGFVSSHGESWSNVWMILLHLAMLTASGSWMLEGVEVL